MKITKKLYWIDRVWYDHELKQTVGDMGFSFCDSDETRTEDFEDLKSGMISSLLEENLDYELQEGETGKKDFPIYYIYSADFTDDCDSANDFNNFCAVRDYDTAKTEFTLAYCSEQAGLERGIEADYYIDPNDLND